MNELDKLILLNVNDRVIPGMVYSIINNKKKYFGCVGYSDLVPEKLEVTQDTLYDIASLTKVLVIVTIISKLIDINKININDKVNKYLDRFKYDDVTVYHLLTHTSGLPADFKSKEIITKNELLNKIYNVDKEYDTGKRVLYSDLGYIILGELIEKIYNNSLDMVAKEEVFIPLEMYNTCYNPINREKCASTEVTEEKGVIKGIVHDEKARSLNGVAGSAGVFTTCADLSNFMFMILNNGIYNNKKFLSKEIIDLWFTSLEYEEENNRYRSLCWIVGKNSLVIDKGSNVISFTGFTGPSISIDRDRKIAICFLTNRIHPSRDNNLLSKRRIEFTNLIYDKLSV